MRIEEIYKKFKVPPNLQEHMERVVDVVGFIEKYWVGEKIDSIKLKRVAEVHDLGNIVKFDFEKHPEFLGEEEKNVDYWKQAQKEIIDRYGSDDHEATRKMLEEIGLEEDLIEIILRKSFGNSVAINNSNNWVLKILYYADMRVLPDGVGSLEDRIEDIRNRIPKYSQRDDFKDLVDSCLEVERQIQENMNVSVEKIGMENQKVDLVNLFIKHPTEKRLLAVMRSKKDKHFGGMWALPGGKIEGGERIEEAARRELSEETGSTLVNVGDSPLLVSSIKIDDKNFSIGIFGAAVKESVFKPQDLDIDKVEWIDSDVLIDSLRKHGYPEDQISALKTFFDNQFGF